MSHPVPPGDRLTTVFHKLGLTSDEIDELTSRLGKNTKGLMIYGSRARGDYVAASDFDILRFASVAGTPTFKVGRVSVSSYTERQLESASGTLFGTHLRRDGRILWDPTRELTRLVTGLAPADPDRLLSRVRHYSRILNQSDEEKRENFSGMVRLARYLLRTAVYAESMKSGPPCFSVRELASRYNEPALATLLASDPDVTGPPSVALLSQLTDRLTQEIGSLPGQPYISLQALAVAYWDTDRNLAALALRAADEDDADSLDYSDLPKVLL